MVALIATAVWASPVVDALLLELTLEERLNQLVIAPPGRGGVPGGLLYHPKDLSDPHQIAPRVVADSEGARIPPLVVANVEGGAVHALRALPELARLPSAAHLATLPDADVQAWGVAAGEAMRRVGFTVDLAPVLDVADTGHLARSRRTFGADPARVKQAGEAFARGLSQAGVAPIGKHFPGYGPAQGDSDLGPVTVDASAADIALWMDGFGTSALAGVLMSNAIYTAFDSKAALTVPALVARARQGDRLVITDDLLVGSRDQAMTRLREAFWAGNDVFLVSAPLDWPGGIDVVAVLMPLVAGNTEAEAQVADSVRRVLLLKEQLGLLR